MPDHTPTPRAVFLSYAREDTEAVRRIADALRAFGVEVWFDQNELRGGDAWDAKIRSQIRSCTLCIPVISATTQSRGEGYFRREWKIAVERTYDMAAGVPFLVPVVIDDTPESAALVPDEFMKVQWTRLARGVPTPQFVEHVKNLLEKPGRPAADAGHSRPATPASASRPATVPAPAKSGPPSWIWAAVAAAVVAGAGVFFFTRKPAPPPVVAQPAAISTEAKPAAAPATPRAGEKSIAVLPFANMSEEKDASAFFADGIHEDILTNLALVKDLRVISRTSVMQYRGTTKSIRQIGEELGVAYVLEGSVRRAGSKVRVTGQLINAQTDEHVWAKAYDRDITDIFAIQSELSQEIAHALSAALSPQEKQFLDRRPTENLAAYDAYLKARQIRQSNQAGIQASEPYLEEAVRLDPNFAVAWAELASTMTQAYFNDYDHNDARLAKAKAAIETAQRLAPDDPDVIERVGDYYYYGFRDFERATEQYLKLKLLRPNDAVVFGSLAFIHRRQGRWAEAVPELRRAAELEPRDLRYGHTLVQLLLGLNRFDEAEAQQRKILALFPDSLTDLGQATVISFLRNGSTKEGAAIIAGLTPDQRNTGPGKLMLRLWARTIGNWEEAVRLDRQTPYIDDFGDPHWGQDLNSAYDLWAYGDREAAVALANRAIPEALAEIAKQPSASAWANLSGAYALVGNKAEALRCAQTARDLIPEARDAVAGPPLSVGYAQTLAWVGEKDQALAELARLLRTPFGENIYIARKSVGWLPLRGDPRFEALVNDPKNNAPFN